MPNNYNDGLEVAPTTLPEWDEIRNPSPPREQVLGSFIESPLDVEPNSTDIFNQSNAMFQRDKKICGVSRTKIRRILFGTSAILVIVLAVCLGVTGDKYKKAKAKLETAEYVTSYANITNGCSGGESDPSGTEYNAQNGNKQVFTMYCGLDLSPGGAHDIFGTFTGRFNNCMEACTVWNSLNMSAKCYGVSFIPAWTNLQVASDSRTDGDCIFKEGPLTKANLTSASAELMVHSALL